MMKVLHQLVTTAGAARRALVLTAALVITFTAMPHAARAQFGEAEALLRQARQALAMGQIERAFQHFEEAFQVNPDYEANGVNLGELLAQMYERRGRTDDAVNVLQTLIERKPQEIRYYDALAGLQLRADKTEDAIATLERSTEANPDLPLGYMKLAQVAEMAERFNKAEEAYRAAAKLSDDDPSPLLSLGLMLLNQRDYQKLGQTMNEGATAFPDTPQFPYIYAVGLRQNKQYDKALEKLLKVEEIAERVGGDAAKIINADYYVELSIVHDYLGEPEKVESVLDEALQKYPRDAGLLNALAYHYAVVNTNLDKALMLSQESLEAVPGNGAFLDTLGWIYFRKGDHEKALKYLQNAAAPAEGDPVVLAHLAENYVALGELDAAENILKVAQAADPKDKDVLSAEAALKKARAAE